MSKPLKKVQVSEQIRTLQARLRDELPEIRPYGEEDWDWTLADEGFELLESGDVLMAERKFHELILARPDDPDGYEGLALVCHEAGNREDALHLIEHALKLAEAAVAGGLLDDEVVMAIRREQQEIQNPAPRLQNQED